MFLNVVIDIAKVSAHIHSYLVIVASTKFGGRKGIRTIKLAMAQKFFRNANLSWVNKKSCFNAGVIVLWEDTRKNGAFI